MLPIEIGVITPYRRQVQKIRNKLKKEGYQEVMVGSTEEFQDQERRVIEKKKVCWGRIYCYNWWFSV